MSFQFTKIVTKKRSKQFFYFHVYYYQEQVETFKLHLKKSDVLKRRQMAFKVENMRKSGKIKNFKFFECIF